MPIIPASLLYGGGQVSPPHRSTFRSFALFSSRNSLALKRWSRAIQQHGQYVKLAQWRRTSDAYIAKISMAIAHQQIHVLVDNPKSSGVWLLRRLIIIAIKTRSEPTQPGLSLTATSPSYLIDADHVSNKAIAEIGRCRQGHSHAADGRKVATAASYSSGLGHALCSGMSHEYPRKNTSMRHISTTTRSSSSQCRRRSPHRINSRSQLQKTSLGYDIDNQ